MTNEQLKSILFMDIETAPIRPSYEELPEVLQEHWTKKTKTFRTDKTEDTDPAKLFTERGGIFSEFSRVVCIGIGMLTLQENEWQFRLKSLCETDEKILLNNFLSIIERFTNNVKEMRFCGHNIKEFDLPFLCRRMIINNIPLPPSLQLNNKKPWEIPHTDTMELWKFGDYKNYTSLDLLAAVLNIPSPKSDIDGSMVGKVFWEDQDYERIATYCKQDVLTTAKVFLHLSGNAHIHFTPVYL